MKKLTVLGATAALAVATMIVIQPVGAASNRVVNAATGSGHITIVGAKRTFSFTVRKYQNGSVKGQAQLVNRAPGGSRVQIVLHCLVVSGNTAYASGHIVRSSNPTFVGKPAIFGVRDNGEGAADPPDQISLAQIFIGGEAVNCTNPAFQAFANPVIAIEAGNVQVR